MGIPTLALLLAAGLAQDPAPEKKPATPWKDFELAVGAFVTDLNAEVEVVGASGLGTSVDVENALGLSDSLTQLRIWGSYRIGERHRLGLDYVDLTRKASRTLDVEIEFNDQVFTAGTVVDTTLELQLITLSYQYSILLDDRMDIALTLGIHTLRTRIELEGQNAGGETESFILPIPLPGIRAKFALTESLFLKQGLDALWLRYANFQGLMIDTTIALEWQAFTHVGFGLGYNSMRIRLGMEEEDTLPNADFEGRFEFDFAGLLLYTTVSF